MTFAPEIAVFDPATGAIAYVTTKANAPASSNTKLASIVLPKGYSEATWDWNATTRTFVENAAKVEAVLIAAVIRDETEIASGRPVVLWNGKINRDGYVGAPDSVDDA